MTNLKLWRLLQGLTQSDAARVIGVSPLTYGYLERGSLNPTDEQWGKLREVFGPEAPRMLDLVNSPTSRLGS